MPSMKAIKRRIASVDSTKQIMKAMNLVAASKLQRAKTQLASCSPLYQHTKEVMSSIPYCPELEENLYFKEREIKNIAYLVISGDRGLCGGYNLNLFKSALALVKRNPAPEKLLVVGSRGYDYFRRRGKNITARFAGINEINIYEKALEIAKQLLDMYKSGEADEIYIVSTKFHTILSQEPITTRLLPLGETISDNKPKPHMSFDPDINTFIDYAVSMHISTIVYGAMVESNVCEQASRMTSMDSAARNAEEIIDDLTLVYNRKRQGAITQEITEIVSGANALN